MSWLPESYALPEHLVLLPVMTAALLVLREPALEYWRLENGRFWNDTMLFYHFLALFFSLHNGLEKDELLSSAEESAVSMWSVLLASAVIRQSGIRSFLLFLGIFLSIGIPIALLRSCIFLMASDLESAFSSSVFLGFPIVVVN
jgi:hypothetical protein